MEIGVYTHDIAVLCFMVYWVVKGVNVFVSKLRKRKLKDVLRKS